MHQIPKNRGYLRTTGNRTANHSVFRPLFYFSVSWYHLIDIRADVMNCPSWNQSITGRRIDNQFSSTMFFPTFANQVYDHPPKNCRFFLWTWHML